MSFARASGCGGWVVHADLGPIRCGDPPPGEVRAAGGEGPETDRDLVLALIGAEAADELVAEQVELRGGCCGQLHGDWPASGFHQREHAVGGSDERLDTPGSVERSAARQLQMGQAGRHAEPHTAPGASTAGLQRRASEQRSPPEAAGLNPSSTSDLAHADKAPAGESQARHSACRSRRFTRRRCKREQITPRRRRSRSSGARMRSGSPKGGKVAVNLGTSSHLEPSRKLVLAH